MGEPSAEGQWRSRRWLALLLRAVIVGVPVLVGSLSARLLAPQAERWSHRWVSVVVVVLVAVAVSLVVSRLTNRLLPLAALLRMTMIFPDKAPSRLKVARRTTGVADIKAKLTSRDLGEQDAAATMLALLTALGRHDRHTRGHSERVRLFCDLLSKELGLSPGDVGRLRWAALVHDIGKLEVPVPVLNKPGKLNSREWDLIREHPDAGARLAAPLKEWLGPWFTGIAEHHERYDGTGYPRGLKATAISSAGRAIAVVDAFETMTASRSYKSARSTMSARAELTRCAGTHFDPIMVRAFLGIALPRLLWSVGPLAFIVNAPFLGWLGEGGRTIGNAVTLTSAGAANVAGVTAVAMAVGAAPTAAVTVSPAADHHQAKAHSSSAPEHNRAATPSTGSPSSTTTPGNGRRNPPQVSRKATAPASAKKAAAPAKKTVAAPPPKKAAPPAPGQKSTGPPPSSHSKPKPPKPPKSPKQSKPPKPPKPPKGDQPRKPPKDGGTKQPGKPGKVKKGKTH
jgi:hypothetical protein